MGGLDEANITIYDTMVKEPLWITNTTVSIPANIQENFEHIVTNKSFYRKVCVL